MGSVWIAGSYQSDFARNYAREGLEISGISPGNFISRMREFEQMEMQFFIRPRRREIVGSTTGKNSAGTGIRPSA